VADETLDRLQPVITIVGGEVVFQVRARQNSPLSSSLLLQAGVLHGRWRGHRWRSSDVISGSARRHSAESSRQWWRANPRGFRSMLSPRRLHSRIPLCFAYCAASRGRRWSDESAATHGR
jgi:hypothetical protein